MSSGVTVGERYSDDRYAAPLFNAVLPLAGRMLISVIFLAAVQQRDGHGDRGAPDRHRARERGGDAARGDEAGAGARARRVCDRRRFGGAWRHPSGYRLSHARSGDSVSSVLCRDRPWISPPACRPGTVHPFLQESRDHGWTSTDHRVRSGAVQRRYEQGDVDRAASILEWSLALARSAGEGFLAGS